MVPVERGFNWSISDCLYGNEEKNRKPVIKLIEELNKYPNLKKVVQKIEGLVNKRSIHASGTYIYNTSYLEFNALMKAPRGQIVTQYDMNDSDYMGGMKFDFLTVKALDKIRLTLEFMIEDKLIEKQKTLKETYQKYLHPDILDYSSPEMWSKVADNTILDLFQFDTEVGSAAAKLIQPTSLQELAAANSLMRLAPSDTNISPLDEYKTFKEDINLWYEEMRLFGLTREEMKILEPHLKHLYGVAETQETVMEIVVNPKIVGFTITEANKLRKAIGKKSEKVMLEIKEQFFQKGKEIGSSENLLNYIWNVQIKRQLGYAFSRNHTMPYSLIALQQMNLAYHYPIVYWNTACLTVNAGSADEDQEKQPTTDYGKIATAIGSITSKNFSVSLPDINESKFGFAPDVKNNRVLFGLKGISKIGDDLAIEIIQHRPYSSLTNFLEKVKISKDKVVNLIKSGAFDSLEQKPREEIMKEYINLIYGAKKRITLQNFQMLSRYNLFPKTLALHVRIFFFNKYLKKFKQGSEFRLDDIALPFYEENFDSNLIEVKNKCYYIKQKDWDKLYQEKMNDVRKYIKENPSLLNELNEILFKEEWDKYALGSLSEWEMEAVSFYHSGHELSSINFNKYEISDFNSIPEEPIILKEYEAYGRTIQIYELYRIIGTVLDRNKIRNTVSLLTPTGVVNMKLYKDQFNYFDKQISERDESTGKKKIIEKSWFKRGNKLLVTGIRRGETFYPKVYKNSPFRHALFLITDIYKDGSLSAEAYRADNEKKEAL